MTVKRPAKRKTKSPKAKKRAKVAAKRAQPAKTRRSAKSAPAKTKKRSPAPKAKKAAKKAALRKVAKTAARKPAKKSAEKPVKKTRLKPLAKSPVRRRDGSGHLDPKYAAQLHELSLESETHDDNRAFFNKPRTGDDLAEELGEEAVEAMTSGQDEAEEALNQAVPEDDGGPFVETNATTEFAEGTDASNPKDAEREPFPTT